jgi:hypothetical protein
VRGQPLQLVKLLVSVKIFYFPREAFVNKNPGIRSRCAADLSMPWERPGCSIELGVSPDRLAWFLRSDFPSLNS